MAAGRIISGIDNAGVERTIKTDSQGRLQITGATGGGAASRLVAKQPYEGAAGTHPITFTEPMAGFVISNDSEDQSLTFTIAGDTYTVKEYEVFEALFEDFIAVSVVANGPFRLYGLKEV